MMTKIKKFLGLLFFTLSYACLVGGYGAFLAMETQQQQFNAGLLFIAVFFPWAVLLGVLAFFCFLRLTKAERAKPALGPRILMFFSLLPGLIFAGALIANQAQ